MHPVLISFGSFSISSFGAFLSLAFLLAVYIIWRLCRVYDINEEKILDISLLTFFGGLLGARIYYIITNLSAFHGIIEMVEVNHYPGLSFWGGAIGAGLALFALTRKFRMDFWHIADFVSVGVFAGLILGSFGCLLGSCESGTVSNLPIAVTQIGLVGKRFPVQFFETILYLLVFLKLWKIGLKFHYNGKVLSTGLILLGFIKFFAEFFRSDNKPIFSVFGPGQILAVLAILFGLLIQYRQTKHSLSHDARVAFSPRFRKVIIPKFWRRWYNLKTNLYLKTTRSWKTLRGRGREILRNLNVKSQPPQY